MMTTVPSRRHWSDPLSCTEEEATQHVDVPVTLTASVMSIVPWHLADPSFALRVCWNCSHSAEMMTTCQRDEEVTKEVTQTDHERHHSFLLSISRLRSSCWHCIYYSRRQRH